MAHMTLPAAHSEADYRLAERIGQTLGLREVHVFWTLATDEPGPEPAERAAAPGGLIGALTQLWGRLAQRR